MPDPASDGAGRGARHNATAEGRPISWSGTDRPIGRECPRRTAAERSGRWAGTSALPQNRMSRAFSPDQRTWHGADLRLPGVPGSRAAVSCFRRRERSARRGRFAPEAGRALRPRPRVAPRPSRAGKRPGLHNELARDTVGGYCSAYRLSRRWLRKSHETRSGLKAGKWLYMDRSRHGSHSTAMEH